MITKSGEDDSCLPFPSKLGKFVEKYLRSFQVWRSDLVSWSNWRNRVCSIVKNYLQRVDRIPYSFLSGRNYRYRDIVLECEFCQRVGDQQNPCLSCEFNNQHLANILRAERVSLLHFRLLLSHKRFNFETIQLIVSYSCDLEHIRILGHSSCRLLSFVSLRYFAWEIRYIIDRRTFHKWITAVNSNQLGLHH